MRVRVVWFFHASSLTLRHRDEMFFLLACFKVDGSARSVNKFDTVS